MKAEYSIEQIREFVKKGHQSVAARFVKAALIRNDELEHRIQSLLRDLQVIHNNYDQVPFEGDWFEITVEAVKNELGIEIEDDDDEK